MSLRVFDSRRSNPQLDEEIASGKEQERPRNDIASNWSDYETMMQEKFGKDLTPHRVKYRTMKR